MAFPFDSIIDIWRDVHNGFTGTGKVRVDATQSGSWSTGRTWTLASGTDSVAAVQSGVWTVQQGNPPWSVSQSGTWSTRTQDGSGTGITSTLFNSKQSFDTRTNDGFSTASNTRPTVTATTTQLLAANTSRRYAYISNQSNVDIFLKLGVAAVASQGILLGTGSIYEITTNNLFTGTINAITLLGTAVVDVFEGTI